mmetsp:Transcript_37014/g.78937  ORF Transcript_37014/g.78937 Transcript_37014/m.78937 type:complete len:93 (+) Transcript_37014:57-335(+)
MSSCKGMITLDKDYFISLVADFSKQSASKSIWQKNNKFDSSTSMYWYCVESLRHSQFLVELRNNPPFLVLHRSFHPSLPLDESHPKRPHLRG